MTSRMRIGGRVALGGAVAVMVAVPLLIGAQEDDPVAAGPPAGEEAVPVAPPNPNPTGRSISPRHGQSPDEQSADAWDCYDEACAQTDWDPYEAYAELVDAGYAVALTREEMEDGLVRLARDGAVTGAVAGEILDDPETGAEIGAAITVASGVVRSLYLDHGDDPRARRVISHFERDLRNWDRKFAACLRPRGYRVTSP